MPLNCVDLDPDPLAQFRRWFAEAEAAVPAAEKMALATASADGSPSARMVLMKQADEDGDRLLLALPEPQGARAGGEPARGAPLLLGTARPAGAHRGRGATGVSHRIRCVLRLAAPRCAAVRGRLAAEPAGRVARVARAARRRARGGGRAGAARVVGRLPARAGRVGVLAARRRPAARPLQVSPRRRSWAIERLGP